MSETKEPIWTPDQVESLNAYQKAGFVHPFTCPTNHAAGRSLVATPHGWECPVCDYGQDWAHDFMLDWSWKAMDPWRHLKKARKPDAEAEVPK